MNKNIRRYLIDGTEILLQSEYEELKRRGINYSFEEQVAMRIYRSYWHVFSANYVTIGDVSFSLKNEADLKVLETIVGMNIKILGGSK